MGNNEVNELYFYYVDSSSFLSQTSSIIYTYYQYEDIDMLEWHPPRGWNRSDKPDTVLCVPQSFSLCSCSNSHPTSPRDVWGPLTTPSGNLWRYIHGRCPWEWIVSYSSLSLIRLSSLVAGDEIEGDQIYSDDQTLEPLQTSALTSTKPACSRE